jgi:hypothetical protein
VHITFVKKILVDGQPCAKCRDVETRLRAGGHWSRLDDVLIADERDPDSAGMRLARELEVERAPFFVVRNGHSTTVHTVYFKFLREVLEAPPTESTEALEILEANPDLDYI